MLKVVRTWFTEELFSLIWKYSIFGVLCQVTIEVVDDPQMEVEMDLAKEGRNDWPLNSEEWLGHKKLFWPLFWEYHDSSEESAGQASLEENGDDLSYGVEDPLLSGVGVDWDSRWKGWDSKEDYGKGAISVVDICENDDSEFRFRCQIMSTGARKPDFTHVAFLKCFP